MAITPLPSAPLISDDPATFNTKAFAFVGALNPMVTEINAELPAIDAAGDAAIAAVGAANFKGEWSTLTGALAIPASVSHENAVYVLKNSLADVTLSEPGTGSPSDWIGVSLPAPGADGNVLTSDGTTWLSEPPSEKVTGLINRAFKTSGTFTPTVSGLYTVIVIGAGGSGGSARSYGTSHVATASGGGAGGTSIKTLALVSGQSYTVTVGAGGAARTTTSGTGISAINGIDGGVTSFSGSGISTISVTGGAGGLAAALSSGTANAAAALGGVGSGGDINYTGGASGASQASNTFQPCASGGGAVNFKGTAFASGSALGGGLVTGGAGIGGTSNYQAGGGTGGNAAFNVGGPADFISFVAPLELTGLGGQISPLIVPGVGGGGAGITSATPAQTSPAYGGGGAVVSSASATAGASLIGGGGGGAAVSNNSGSLQSISGAGGNGIVLILGSSL